MKLLSACESFFGRLKTELFYPRDWTATTIEQFVKELDAYTLMFLPTIMARL
jgi:hypothetical protein